MGTAMKRQYYQYENPDHMQAPITFLLPNTNVTIIS